MAKRQTQTRAKKKRAARQPSRSSGKQKDSSKLLAASVSPSERWNRWSTTAKQELAWFFTGVTAQCVRFNSQTVASQQIRLYRTKPGDTASVPERYMGLYRGRSLERRSVPASRRKWLVDGARCYGTKVVSYIERGEIEEVEGHPVLDLISKPNPEDNGFEFWAQQLAYEEICGESFFHTVWSPQAVELWPMMSQWVTPDIGEGGELLGWLYGKSEPREWFGLDEVLYKRFEKSLFRTYMGDGPMRSAYMEAKMRASMTTHSVNLFERGARPDGHLTYKDRLTSDQIEEVRGEIHRVFGSTENWSQWLITGGGGEFTPIGWSPKELDYSQSRKDIATEIAGIFGVPESMLRLNDANLASAQTANIGYMRFTILPRCVRLQEWMTNNLLPLFGAKPGEWFFAVDNPVPEDETANRLNVRADVQAGILTINEGRAAIGYEPLGPEYDVPMVNGIPAGQRPEPVNPFAGFLSVERAERKALPEKDDDADDHDLGAGAGVPARRSGDCPEGSAVSLGVEPTQCVGVLDSEGCPDADSVVDGRPAPHSHRALWLGNGDCCKALEEGDPSPLYPEPPAGLEVQIEAFFARQRDAFIAAMQRSAGELTHRRPAVKDDRLESRIAEFLRKWGITDTEVWTAALAEIVKPDTDQRLIAAATEAVRIIEQMVADQSPGATEPLSFFIEDERAARFVERYTAGLLDGLESVNRTTADAISATLAEGIREGEGLATLTNRVRVAFDETVPSGQTISQYRASAIARTETARAQSQGQLAGWATTNVVVGRKWVLAPNACEFCEAVAKSFDGVAVPLGDSYLPKGTVLTGTDGGVMNLDFTDIDSVPLHPKCRCYEEPVLRSAQ